MQNPLLIFRIGWMDTYQGVDEIHGEGHTSLNMEKAVRCGTFAKKAGDITAM